MKKLLKCSISIVLVISVVLCFTCTSFAASTSWGGSFPTVQQGTSSTYNYAVQAILYRYNSSIREIIAYSGGVDGGFGSGTHYAVVAYQGDRGLQADGIVGSDTWDSFYNRLSYYKLEDNYTYYRISNGGVKYYETAIKRRYEAVTGAVVKGWYAVKDDGTDVWFSSY